MKSLKRVKTHLNWLFTLTTSIVMVASSLIIIAVQFPIMGADPVAADELKSFWQVAILIFAAATLVIGFLLSFLAGRIILQPINQLLDGMERLTEGEYGARVHLGASREMQIIADEFNSLASELEHTEIMRSDFINDFSHEFKTPLASIKGLTALMKSGRVSPEKQREYLTIIEEEADRLSAMTTNILNLSKIQNQQIVIDRTEYNLSEQIRGTLAVFEKRWLERGLSVAVEMGEHDIFASEDLLRIVWTNLIDNAVKFADEGSEIGVSVSEREGCVSVAVTNACDGIPRDELERIFHKFYRGGSTVSRPGNGIGLYISKNIVELHSGSITAASSEGSVTFTVEIPHLPTRNG